ncbi:liprin-beta-2 isoform X8 [Denticeps clupeoides]|uniref:liprin-beta-2 isoform X8 n=1 Tax=Denticeps clupeoides TaxID=299321 RepID=UPI0010A49499|nr:liprin-beta-2-like isoform X8 [Denticeps clupeoides]
MASNASHMLEAALEQMDDIIAGSKAMVPVGDFSDAPVELRSTDCPAPLRVLQLAEELKVALEVEGSSGAKEALRRQVPSATTHALLLWLNKGPVNLQSLGNNESYQDRLARLEGHKESLVLQVSVLTDQVEAQGEKIRDLENSLEEHHQKLSSTEEMLQQELRSRTSLESQKLDLMDEVSYLKLKLVGMEEKQSHNTERQHKAEGLLQELRLLRDKVNELEDEKSQYERKLKATKAEISNLQHLLLTKKTEIEHLQAQLLSRAPVSMDSAEREEIYRRRLNNKHQELQRLKTGMESLIAANEEKDRRIEELTILLSQCRQFREVTVVMPVARERVLTGSSEDGRMNGDVRMRSFSLKAHSELSSGSSPVLPSPLSNQRDNESRLQPRLLSSSMEDLQSASTQKNLQNGTLVEPAENQNRDESLTPPGQRSLPEPKRASDSSDSSAHKTPDESEDGDFSLRKTEKTDDTTSSDVSPMSSGADSGQQSPVAQENKNNKSIKKLWGKIRRTQSGGLNGDDLGPTEFRRGGLRATAGPRLARTPDSGSSVCDKNTPFSKWTREQVCGWLEDFGLGQYVNLSRQWIESGQTLLSATPQDFEKEMGIKHPLHRKKLQLAMRTFSTKMMEKYSEVDPIWVTRWLDDIGLPQYKDQFHESRVDGRMLQYLTVNDLLFLKVTSQLHHLSIKCAIHVLHVNKFNPYCLRRRPGDENKTSPSEVVQWSNHRVMEWLRSVDLAEYAPNLRGSGVHGGLIILEPRFNSDTLAMLLNIPPQKTLLRRHLATNFTSLVGPQAQQEKREYATATGHTPLTTTAKVRPKKLGFTHFGHLRKRRPDDSADYICPIDTASLLSVNGGPHRPYGSFRGLSPIRDTDTDTEKVEQVGSKF